MKTFAIGEALEFGWRTTRAHSALLFQIVLTFFAIQVAQDMVNRVLPHTAVGFVAGIVLTILSIFAGAGFIAIAVKLAHGHAAHYRDLFPSIRVVWPFFVASVLAGLCMAVGFVLLIIPGIIVTIRLSMVRFEVVDRGGIIDSLKRSWRETEGHWWHLFGFFVILVGINLLGVAALLIGLFVSIPVSVLAWAHVYLALKKHH